MIFDLIILSVCTFVVLPLTRNIFITAGAFTGCYIALKAFGNDPVTALLIWGAILFVYGAVLFLLLKRFREEGSTVAFVLTFALSMTVKGFLFGWG